ncbi:MAG: hypothetical protein SGI92_01995 [Bryobacteraceae bacterium]|nr:hypothetical protein [Bryobacteraceae bacterium]
MSHVGDTGATPLTHLYRTGLRESTTSTPQIVDPCVLMMESEENMPGNTGSGQNGEPATLAEVARELMIYLLRHRDARDTVDGILDWWLPGTAVSRSVLETALKELCRQDWIESERRSTDVVLFGLNKAKVSEILEHLATSN